MSRHSVLPVRYQYRSFWRDIEAGPSDANPYPVPRAACLDDCAADVLHQAMTHAHRIRFHVKAQPLRLLVMERR